MIYCLDLKNIIGSGSFGIIFRARALRLLEVSKDEKTNKRTVMTFAKMNMAVKQLKGNTVYYDQQGYKVDRKRELIILSLIREIKYEEGIKQARRLLHL
jgi:3-hydroxyacyl-CoA dehydrogenase